MPAWFAPPEETLAGVAPVDGFVHRGDRAVMGLKGVEAYQEGCLFHLQTWVRPTTDATVDEWEELQGIVLRGLPRVRNRLTDEVERFGVEYADGTKVTTLDDPFQGGDERPPWEQDRPDRPVLRHHGGRGGGGGDDHMTTDHSLWLWPLPPGERFDFVVEWPAVGISLTRVSLDGAAIHDAAARAQPIWPDPDTS